MIDSGCNSLLLPFPVDMDALLAFHSGQYFWEVVWSLGTGVINSPTLLIYCPETNEEVGNLCLAGRFVVGLKGLRFHMGKNSTRRLLDADILDVATASKLRGFLQRLKQRDAPERRHVLFGQTVLSKIFSLQAGVLLLLTSRGYFLTRQDFPAALRVIRRFQNLGLTLTEFHDLDEGDILGAWSDEM